MQRELESSNRQASAPADRRSDPAPQVHRHVRFACWAAPAFMLGYGVVRLIDGADGTHGPGPAWTIGHVLFLIGLSLFGVVVVGLRAMLSGARLRSRIVANLATAFGLVGLLSFVRVILIDIIVGLRAVDHDAMSALYDRYDNDPIALPSALYDVGPAFFFIGLVALLALQVAATPRRLPAWSPALVVLGFVVIQANLDLLPLGAALFLASLRPVVAPTSRRGAVDTRTLHQSAP